jgi:GTP cyclohydrolase II
MPDVPLVRVHSECLTGDLFGSERCDCGPQLRESLGLLSARGGYLLYLRQEGRGIGLYAKVDAYLLQDAGLDTFAANRMLGYRDDERSFGVAAEMLWALGLREVDLVTNNPDKRAQLEAHGVVVRAQVRTSTHLTQHNGAYLSAKEAAGHRVDTGNLVVLPAARPGWEEVGS